MGKVHKYMYESVLKYIKICATISKIDSKLLYKGKNGSSNWQWVIGKNYVDKYKKCTNICRSVLKHMKIGSKVEAKN